MALSVDLNADMGESFGPWTMGDDTSLLDVITSANVACGYHAGDPDVMYQTMSLAAKAGVGIGAHPGFPDLQGFGRRKMHVPHATIGNMVRYQLGAAQAIARATGAEVRHLKLHGALANMASVDADLAKACYEAALDVAPDIFIMVLAATAMEEVVRGLGCNWCGEIFADRAYNDDATLVDRSLPGAVIHDPAVAGHRILKMVQSGAVITESGKEIPAAIDTICLHGDTPSAVLLAKAVRQCLEEGGVAVQKFSGRSTTT
ncbi:5-oxoprolinase subunit PxpA [Epibacterium ulvae]|uniref:LamB/YcsF family protein n=1 Tax=Epibacterium ulvae TaxID=1156985 RepID=UPI001BFC49A6|nr:5-oxoprolinase subunit PxpA [Epibacterium ulvae]MBT8153653.1 5-oxoprolinase subunit PxpA [Epibacterium ulvae]